MTIIVLNRIQYELDSRIEVGALVVKLIIENNFSLNDIAINDGYSISRYNVKYPISFIGHIISVDYTEDNMNIAYIKSIRYYINKYVRINSDIIKLINIIDDHIETRRLLSYSIGEIFMIDSNNYNNNPDELTRDRIIRCLSRHMFNELNINFDELPTIRNMHGLQAKRSLFSALGGPTSNQ